MPEVPFGHNETKKVNLDAFFAKYISVMPYDFYFYLCDIEAKGYRNVTMSTFYIEELDKRLTVKEQREKLLKQCAERNTRGQELEKEGKITQAIAIYEKNIEGECYPATHSFDRLMILYRKQQDYDNEIRVINRAIEVLCPRYPNLKDRYEKRLQKASAFLCPPTTLNQEHKKELGGSVSCQHSQLLP